MPSMGAPEAPRSVRRGSVRALASAALAAGLLASVAAAAPAEAKVPKGAVKKLRQAPCPVGYQVRIARDVDDERAAAARRGVFRIAGRDVKIERRMNWRYDPVGSPSFRARLHDLRWLDDLLHSYRTGGDRRALRRAKRIVVDWVKQNPLADPSTDRTWFDKVVGDRAPYVTYVTRAAQCEGMLKSKRLARRLLGSIDTHTDFLADPGGYSATNRGLFMDLGLLLSGRLAPFLPKATKKRRLGQRRFVRTIDSLTHFREAFWRENSTTYQFLVINVLGRFLELTKRKRPTLENLHENMKQTSAWLIEPDNRWLQMGNSYQDRTRFATQLAREARGMRVLERSGLAFVRKGRKYLALLSTFGAATHKHSDDLSFDLYDKGRRIVSDTGIPSKDPGHQYSFSQSAQAHSVLTADGLDFPRDPASSYGSGILASGQGNGWFAIEATNPLLTAQGIDHRRTLLYRPGYALLVADRVRSASSHGYRRYLHFGPQWRLDALADRLVLRDEGKQVSVFSTGTDPDQVRQVVRGRTEPLQGFVFTGFRERDPRWTTWFANDAADLDAVISIGMRKRKPARATALDPLGDATDTFEIDENGEPARTLTLTRPSPGRLKITQRKPEYDE